MLAVMCGLFLVALDQTIVSTALSSIVEEFNSFSSLSWVVTAYLLGNTVTVPIAGKLSDLFGRRIVLMVGVAIFTITSFFSGSAADINQLIIARAIQGIGGGIIMANAFTIVGDLFSPRERGRWQGLIGAVFAVSSVIGPLLGGFLTDHHTLFGLVTSWRWNFWLNVPIGILAFAFIAKYCPRIRHDHKPAIDYLGAGTLTVALSSLILAVDNTDKIFAGLIADGVSLGLIKVILYAAAAIFGAAFVWLETKAEEPIIPLDFFKNRTFRTIMAVALFFGAAFLGAIIYLTQFNMQVFGVSATDAGLMLLPMVGGLTLTSALTGLLVTKTGKYKRFFIGGLSLATISVFALTTLTPSSPYWHEAIIMAFVGIGLGTGMPIMNLAVKNEFEQKHLGAATASSQLFRGLGSTVGVAVLGAMLTSGVTSHLGNIGDDAYIQRINSQPEAAKVLGDGTANTVLNLNTKDAKDKIMDGLNQKLDQSNVSSETKQQIKQQFRADQDAFSAKVSSAFSKSLRPIFYVSATLMAVATVVAWGVKEKPLRGRPDDTPGAE
ncbi:MAG TPA: MDR family MFS transporter [Candidatus Saccharimonadales bacterium]|nr:MDR family MFS transporter [Candidatus Saccharimonadales bacterium]